MTSTGTRCAVCHNLIRSDAPAQRFSQGVQDAWNKEHKGLDLRIDIGSWCHAKCIQSPHLHAYNMRDLKTQHRLLQNLAERQRQQKEHLQKQVHEQQQQLTEQQQQQQKQQPDPYRTLHPSLSRFLSTIPSGFVSDYDLVIDFETAWSHSQNYYHDSDMMIDVSTTSTTPPPGRNTKSTSNAIQKCMQMININTNQTKTPRHQYMNHIMTTAEFAAISAPTTTSTQQTPHRGRSISIYDVPYNSSNEPLSTGIEATKRVLSETGSESVRENGIKTIAEGIDLPLNQTLYGMKMIEPANRSTSRPVFETSYVIDAGTGEPTKTFHEYYANASYSALMDDAKMKYVEETPFQISSISVFDYPYDQQVTINRMCRILQQLFNNDVPLSHDSIMWEFVFPKNDPLDGFGPTASQRYITSVLGYTPPHDEMLYSAAYNYMLAESRGAALWIAFNINDLKNKMSMVRIADMIQNKDGKDQEDAIYRVGDTIDLFIANKIPIDYVIQKPGQLVVTPSGQGCMHLVITIGPLVEKIAWNYTFTNTGAQRSIDAWMRSSLHDYLIIETNSSLANFNVLPLFTMQQRGYVFGLHEYLVQLIDTLKLLPSTSTVMKHSQFYYISSPIKHQRGYCCQCLYFLDWLVIRINNDPSTDMCIVCWAKKVKPHEPTFIA